MERLTEMSGKDLKENPCYHCYTGATGQCYMTNCKYQFESWAKDVEAGYIIPEGSKEQCLSEKQSMKN